MKRYFTALALCFFALMGVDFAYGETRLEKAAVWFNETNTNNLHLDVEGTTVFVEHKDPSMRSQFRAVAREQFQKNRNGMCEFLWKIFESNNIDDMFYDAGARAIGVKDTGAHPCKF